jgi:hypothetical protein
MLRDLCNYDIVNEILKERPLLVRLQTSLAGAAGDTEVAEVEADSRDHVVRKEVATPMEGLTGRSSALSGTRQRKEGSGCSLTKGNTT